MVSPGRGSIALLFAVTMAVILAACQTADPPPPSLSVAPRATAPVSGPATEAPTVATPSAAAFSRSLSPCQYDPDEHRRGLDDAALRRARQRDAGLNALATRRLETDIARASQEARRAQLDLRTAERNQRQRALRDARRARDDKRRTTLAVKVAERRLWQLETERQRQSYARRWEETARWRSDMSRRWNAERPEWQPFRIPGY